MASLLGGGVVASGCEGTRELEIESALSVLESRIREVMERSDSLRDRLSPLCSAVPPTPCGNSATSPAACALAVRIFSLVDGVERANGSIGQIQSTLQI